MNAITPIPSTQSAEGAVAANLAALQKLIELGMRLAERAADEITAEPKPIQGTNEKPRRRGPDPRYVFLRLSLFVTKTVALHATLSGHLPTRKRRTSSPTPSPNSPTLVNEVIETARLPQPVKTDLRAHLAPTQAQTQASSEPHPLPQAAPAAEGDLPPTARHSLIAMKNRAAAAQASHRACLATHPKPRPHTPPPAAKPPVPTAHHWAGQGTTHPR